ncbi:MAG TPA: helix-turn-helix domain-containing protein, partial [Methylomirabilota bacterium]|nr:helix-turn-helix domain-containing protein [Methylomirabilota bacterium]
TLDERIQGMRLQVIRRAAQVGVSAACAEAGISRTLFYRRQHRLSWYGVDGLHPRRLRARPGRPPQLPAQVERRLLAVAIAEATWGAQRLAAYAQRLWRLRVAASTVQRLLRRHGLATRRQRLLVLEHHSARDAGLLTQRTRQVLWRLRHGQTRHVEAERPGELLCLDTFYIGKLKGVGTVWQVTACDVASSYGVARILPELTAAAVATFLRTVVVPAVRQAGWAVERVLTDGGGVQSRVRGGVSRTRDPPHTYQAAARLDQRLRRAPAADCTAPVFLDTRGGYQDSAPTLDRRS